MEPRFLAMDPLTPLRSTQVMANARTSDPTHSNPPLRPDPAMVRKALAKRSFCLLATTSERGRPHAAGVLYALADEHLYVSTMRSSRKARNVAATTHVGVFLPVRRLPIGPPSSIQFQATADVLAVDDPDIRRHVDAGQLRSITSHGELELPDGCFLRIAMPDRVHTYGLGMSLRRLISDPLNGAGVVDLTPAR